MTTLSCENPSNIWELNYGPQVCGANKLTGKMELVLLLSSWSSLFSHVLFSAMFSCFLLDSYELQEIISITLYNEINLSARFQDYFGHVWKHSDPALLWKIRLKREKNLNHYLLCQIFDNMILKFCLSSILWYTTANFF